MVRYYKMAVENRKWKKGMLRTVNGTLEHSVRTKLKDVKAPTLLVTGLKDRICDPKTAEAAARELPNGYFRAIPKCGHAPQIEKARLINQLVVRYLKDKLKVIPPALDADRFLEHAAKRGRCRGLEVFGIGADIADVRKSEGDDLPGIGRIGHDLLIAGDRGVEADLAHRAAFRAEALAPDRGAIG